MKKILTTFSIVVIALFALSIFGWMSSHIAKGDKDFGFLNGTVKFMSSFPDLFSQSVEEVKTLPPTFIKTPEDFTTINELNSNLYVLTTYSDTSDSRSVILKNLKNDSVLYKWTLENPFLEHDRIQNPLLYPNKSLVYAYNDIGGLRRIDSLGNVLWKQDTIHIHHAMNKDKNGDIWACSFVPVFYATSMYKLNGSRVFHIDNYISKIDAETGRILFHKSLVEILKENDLAAYILKSANVKDPIHLNDVEPALETTPYYNEDDVFISCRNISLIFHYRPSTNEVLEVIEGPFTSQHDVDIIDDHRLVFFNNNYYTLWSDDSKPVPKDSVYLKDAGDFYSNIIEYDLRTKKFTFIGDSIFRANQIFTETEGLVEFINPTTYFVEEQNSGLLWIIDDNKVIYRDVFRSQHKGYHHLPNWTRILKDYD